MRTYTEAEVADIIARASRQTRPAATDETPGLTLAEIERLGAEAGLDPAALRAAAAEIDAPAPSRHWGAPADAVAQRVVTGTVSEEAWERIVATARAEFGRAGIAGQIGRTREWTAVGASNNAQPTTRLALEPTADGTRIVLSQSVRDAMLGFTIGGSITSAMAVVFGVLTALNSDPEIWVATLILSVVSVLLLGGSQVGLRVWQRRQEHRFERLLDRFELAVRTSARTPAEEAGLAVPAGRIDPALFADDLPEPAVQAGRPRTRS